MIEKLNYNNPKTNTMMKKLILIFVLIGFAFAGMNAQNNVTVEVSGIENHTGKLYIALYDAKTPFLSQQALTGEIVDIAGNSTKVTFEVPEKGEYAIALFQDENNNGKLDLGEKGIPVEKYGFSNNVDPAELKRVPLFDECKFTIDDSSSISISLISANK